MTEPTLVFMMTTISGWMTTVFTGFDSIHIWNVSYLDILVIFEIIGATIWFVKRVIDSPKSDN